MPVHALATKPFVYTEEATQRRKSSGLLGVAERVLWNGVAYTEQIIHKNLRITELAATAPKRVFLIVGFCYFCRAKTCQNENFRQIFARFG
jgi:hypothetical protein